MSPMVYWSLGLMLLYHLDGVDKLHAFPSLLVDAVLGRVAKCREPLHSVVLPLRDSVSRIFDTWLYVVWQVKLRISYSPFCFLVHSAVLHASM